MVKVGVWESSIFIGAVVFSWGANYRIGSPYGLTQYQVCECTRVALREHWAPVSQIVSRAVKMLRAQSPGVRLIVSYADPLQGHRGAIYQAMNWVYVGRSQGTVSAILGGEVIHKRTIHRRYGTLTGQEKTEKQWKHKYLYPLDRAMRRQIVPLAQPYPKRAGG